MKFALISDSHFDEGSRWEECLRLHNWIADDIAARRDIEGGAKLAWSIFALIPLVPFLYVLTGGDLW